MPLRTIRGPTSLPLKSLSDMESLRSFISSPASLAPFDIAWSPVLLLVLFVLHWSYAVLSVLCIAVLASMNLLGDALSRRAMLAANGASANALRRAGDAMTAAEAVLPLGMLPTLSRLWTQAQAEASALVHRATLRARTISAATGTLRFAMTGAMVALGLILALNGLASSGSMVAANMILARILLPFHSVASTRRQWVDALASWRRLEFALGNPVPHRYQDAMPDPESRLVIDNLSYIPPGGDRPVLRNISFTVQPGEAIGIIGPSSSGKSTLLRLILGITQPTAGGAYLDGTSTYLWEREDFARHVGYVPQRPVLLVESVAENISRMQKPDLRAVIAAAKRAGIHRSIAGLPHGYATCLSANTLSGGQRQRVALARALYAHPRLLILDEPSAFLDQAGETDIISLIAQLRVEGVTLLVVSHRPSLLTSVDKVLLLQDGAAPQFGPRSEILPTVLKPSVRLITQAASR